MVRGGGGEEYGDQLQGYTVLSLTASWDGE